MGDSDQIQHITILIATTRGPEDKGNYKEVAAAAIEANRTPVGIGSMPTEKVRSFGIFLRGACREQTWRRC